jgi:hypothetical protein
MREAVIRSAWILHGRDMIYNAVERNFHIIPGESEEKGCERQKEMIDCGAWYIRAAMQGPKQQDMEEEKFLRPLYGPA